VQKLEKSAQTRETLWAPVTQFPDLVFGSRMVLPHPRCLVISRLRGSHDVILGGAATDQASAHLSGGAAGAVLPPSSSVSTLVLEVSEQSSIALITMGQELGLLVGGKQSASLMRSFVWLSRGPSSCSIVISADAALLRDLQDQSRHRRRWRKNCSCCSAREISARLLCFFCSKNHEARPSQS